MADLGSSQVLRQSILLIPRLVFLKAPYRPSHHYMLSYSLHSFINIRGATSGFCGLYYVAIVESDSAAFSTPVEDMRANAQILNVAKLWPER